MQNPSPDKEYASKAANPNSMGGHGQPEGRPTKPDEGRDHNHPQGSSSPGAGPQGGSSKSQPGTPGY